MHASHRASQETQNLTDSGSGVESELSGEACVVRGDQTFSSRDIHVLYIGPKEVAEASESNKSTLNLLWKKRLTCISPCHYSGLKYCKAIITKTGITVLYAVTF